MHRVRDCRASKDYRLWLSFDDGLEGNAYLANPLEIRAFLAWPGVDRIERFSRTAVDKTAATVVWDAGVRFDADILHQDPLSSRSRKEFNPLRLASAVE